MGRSRFDKPDLAARMRLARHTTAYARMTAAGFTFEEIETDANWIGHIVVTCHFMCVCGRRERYIWRPLPKELSSASREGTVFVDVAANLESIGSVSVEHLRADGYSEREIERIRAPYTRAGL